MPGYRGLVGLSGEGGILYRYTSSLSHDSEIAPEAVLVVTAHTVHLAEKGVIDMGTACPTLKALLELTGKSGGLEANGSYEDVWEYIEAWLHDKTGGASQNIWLGRSRNDHVSAALRLYTLKRIREILEANLKARREIIEKAGEYSGVPVLLHTHQQPSQLARLDCLLMGWEEALASAFTILYSVVKVVDRSPLSASAGAGTLAPIDPGKLASLLGFNNVISNPVYASGSRLDVTAAAAAASLYLMETSRIAGDLIFLSNPYIGVVKLPRDHVATSSIMPHKENPATLEVLRARAARAQGLLSAITSMQTGLPTGYSLDLQEANPLLYTILKDALEATVTLIDIIKGSEWDTGKLSELVGQYVAYGAELAEYMAIKKGIPFREAYSLVGKAAREGRIGMLLHDLGLTDPLILLGKRATGCKEGVDLSDARDRLTVDTGRVEDLSKRLKVAYKDLPVKAEEAVAKLCS